MCPMSSSTGQGDSVRSYGFLSPKIIATFEGTAPGLERKTKRIFVIDDEVFIADSLVDILNDCGYDAHSFYNGQAAIDVAKHKSPDIVISDVMMPTLNGVETAIL